MPDLLAFAEMLDPKQLGEHAFAVPAQDQSQEFYPAGTIAAIVAYAVAADFPEQELRSTHLAFVGAASPGQPLTAELSILRNGRQLISVSVSVIQEDRLCAHGYAILGPQAPDVIRHQVDTTATVPGPAASAPAVTPST